MFRVNQSDYIHCCDQRWAIV